MRCGTLFHLERLSRGQHVGTRRRPGRRRPRAHRERGSAACVLPGAARCREALCKPRASGREPCLPARRSRARGRGAAAAAARRLLPPARPRRSQGPARAPCLSHLLRGARPGPAFLAEPARRQRPRPLSSPAAGSRGLRLPNPPVFRIPARGGHTRSAPGSPGPRRFRIPAELSHLSAEGRKRPPFALGPRDLDDGQQRLPAAPPAPPPPRSPCVSEPSPGRIRGRSAGPGHGHGGAAGDPLTGLEERRGPWRPLFPTWSRGPALHAWARSRSPSGWSRQPGERRKGRRRRVS